MTAKATPPLTPEGFAAETGVSRETLERLTLFAELLVKWQRAVNLVAADSLRDLWRRHMLDSAQLYPLLPSGCRRVLDIGSGAGFPGLVLAAMGVPEIHLVESDQRKCAFQREVARVAGLPVTVHAMRIEKMAPFAVDAITSRACAELPQLLDYSAPFLGSETVCLFLKGKQVERELTEAGKGWKMHIERFKSRSDPTGTVLRLSHVEPVRPHRDER
jgi:16S rRNA (guanine527-N7)-methyltransferase